MEITRRALNSSSARVTVIVFCPKKCRIGEVYQTDIGPVFKPLTPANESDLRRRREQLAQRVRATIPDSDPVEKWKHKWHLIAGPPAGGARSPVPLAPDLFSDPR